MNNEDFNISDISTELQRAYVYAGVKYIIENPKTLFVKKSDTYSHRVVDSEGIVHYPRKDWLAIQWKPIESTEPVQF